MSNNLQRKMAGHGIFMIFCTLLFGNFTPNRGLSLGDNRFGTGDIFSALALGPAYLFGVLALIALFIIDLQAFKPARSNA